MSQTNIPLGSVFATHAPVMRRAGFAVVPARGKQPIRKAIEHGGSHPGWKSLPSGPSRNLTPISSTCRA